MKLLDQVFKVYSPYEWSEHLPIKMPSYWTESTLDIDTAELEFMNWNSGFVMVAKYSCEDQQEPFVIYRESAEPTSLRLTFKEGVPHETKAIYGKKYSGRTLHHSCGCCITLLYTEAK